MTQAMLKRPTLDEMPDPMFPKHISQLVGLSVDLIYDEIHAGRLTAKKLGGEKRPTYLITHAWYREWLTVPAGSRKEG